MRVRGIAFPQWFWINHKTLFTQCSSNSNNNKLKTNFICRERIKGGGGVNIWFKYAVNATSLGWRELKTSSSTSPKFNEKYANGNLISNDLSWPATGWSLWIWREKNSIIDNWPFSKIESTTCESTESIVLHSPHLRDHTQTAIFWSLSGLMAYLSMLHTSL